MVSIRRVLAQIKAEVATVLGEEHLTHVQELGTTWRERLLSPVVTLQIFVLQILHGNTAMTDLPRLSGRAFTLALLFQQGVHVVVRMRGKQLVDFRPRRPAARHAYDKGRPRSIWVTRWGREDSAGAVAAAVESLAHDDGGAARRPAGVPGRPRAALPTPRPFTTGT